MMGEGVNSPLTPSAKVFVLAASARQQEDTFDKERLGKMER